MAVQLKRQLVIYYSFFSHDGFILPEAIQPMFNTPNCLRQSKSVIERKRPGKNLKYRAVRRDSLQKTVVYNQTNKSHKPSKTTTPLQEAEAQVRLHLSTTKKNYQIHHKFRPKSSYFHGVKDNSAIIGQECLFHLERDVFDPLGRDVFNDKYVYLDIVVPLDKVFFLRLQSHCQFWSELSTESVYTCQPFTNNINFAFVV